jgi:hypothetical protein
VSLKLWKLFSFWLQSTIGRLRNRRRSTAP